MTDLKYYKMYSDVKSPKFATEGSACFDMCAYIKPNMEISVYDMSNHKIKRKPEWYDDGCSPKLIFRVAPADRVLIPTGLIFDIPEDHSVRLHPRSSISLKKGLTMPNGEGIIDADYYHQTFVMFYNASADEVFIKSGERIAQGELIKNHVYEIEETKNVPEQKTNRVGGFGSTGVK
tara:strand:+ start:831 stop:1361 length:531 start_codon:yes stop_codon:yes gene_type:complete